MNIRINKQQDDLLENYAVGMLKDFYLLDKEQSPQEGFARAAKAWSGGDKKLAQRLYDYVSQKWFMFASPVLSNAPAETKPKALPISCFLTYVPDTVEGLIEHSSELRWLSVKGGGVGGHWDDVRTVSDIAPGPIPFLHTVDADMIAYRQGKTRKGSYAAYMSVHHPDLMEFLNIRVPTADVQRKALNIHNAINITNEFMRAVQDDLEYELRDPKDNSVKEKLKARKVWERIMEVRFRTGEPYLNFIDTANKFLPRALRDKGLKIHGSNLCNEIHLPTNKDRTAVCCLSSLNLEYYGEWKDTPIVEDLVTMLDNVLTYFIDNAPDVLSKAKYSAARERSIGLGAMGFHSLLQQRNIPWESVEASVINHDVFSLIKDRAVAQSRVLAKSRGEYLDGVGTGKRHSHLLAIAPNASSSIILSTSPSIEPVKANAYTHRTRAGSFLVKNKYLEKLLEEKGVNTDSVWTSIITNKGSVQHLKYLTDEEKAVYKTADELNQSWVVRHASDRQPYICQGQSVNLFFPSGASKAYVNRVHIQAWADGLKGLYYLRTESTARAENVSEKVERVALKSDNRSIIYGKDDCPYCQLAKVELTLRNIDYEYISLEDINKTASEVTGRDVYTVPQIYIGGQYIGGYAQLMETEDEECLACEG